jgi:flagellar assembly factor FliW
MIRVETTRFGTLEIPEATVIDFPGGLVGFPSETRFAFLQGSGTDEIAHLQSLRTPAIALPVIDGATFGAAYPRPEAAELARGAGLAEGNLAVLVTIAAAGVDQALCANLLAPIVVDLTSRKAAQVVLDPRQYSTATPVAVKIG